jgi:hypothetical protein
MAKGRDEDSSRPARHHAKYQLRRIRRGILQGAIDHPHHVVVDLLRGTKDLADGRKRLVGDGLILGLVGLAAATAAGATATPDFVHAEDHDHQVVPSDLALRTKSLESLLVERGWSIPQRLTL